MKSGDWRDESGERERERERERRICNGKNLNARDAVEAGDSGERERERERQKKKKKKPEFLNSKTTTCVPLLFFLFF